MAITRRQAVRSGAAALAAPFINRGRFALFAQETREYSERAVRLVRESLIVDMLNQFLYRRDQAGKLQAWLSKPGAMACCSASRTQTTLCTWRTWTSSTASASASRS